MLIAVGADVEAAEGHTTNRKTPSILAILSGQLEVAQLLVQAGANLRASIRESGSHRDFTPLRWALDHCSRTDKVTNLPSNASIEAKNYAGWVPLHEAAYWGWNEVINILIHAGANMKLRQTMAG